MAEQDESGEEEQLLPTAAAGPTSSQRRPKAEDAGAAELALQLLKLAWPVSFAAASQAIPQSFILLIFVGRLGSTDYVAGTGMAFMLTAVTAVSVFAGMGSGMVGLCSQSFGAKNYQRCGDVFQRQLLILFVLCVPIAYIWLDTERLLLSLQQPAAAARLCGEFMRYRLPALPFLVSTAACEHTSPHRAPVSRRRCWISGDRYGDAQLPRGAANRAPTHVGLVGGGCDRRRENQRPALVGAAQQARVQRLAG